MRRFKIDRPLLDDFGHPDLKSLFNQAIFEVSNAVLLRIEPFWQLRPYVREFNSLIEVFRESHFSL